MSLTPAQRELIEERRQRAIERRKQIIRDRINENRFWANTKRRMILAKREAIRKRSHKEWFYKTDKPKPRISLYNIGQFKELGAAKKAMIEDYMTARNVDKEALKWQYAHTDTAKLKYRVLKAKAEWYRKRAQAQKNAIMTEYQYNKRYFNYKPPIY